MSTVEKLKEEIDAKRRFIASLPPVRSREDVCALAKHQQIVGEKEEEYELVLEKQRRDSVVREHEELHPPITETCPICLEEISIATPGSISYFLCCGNGICVSCAEATTQDDVDLMLTCPLCRAEFLRADEIEKKNNLLRQRALDGRSWAQYKLGINYLEGRDGFPLNHVEALKWLKLAAEQRYPPAICELAKTYATGEFVEQSKAKAIAMMEEAANVGNVDAQVILSMYDYWQDKGASVDESEVKVGYYSTLAYCQDQNPLVGSELGNLFFVGSGGFDESIYRAKYYFEEAAKKGCERAYAQLALILLQLCEAQYNGNISIPGHSCIPMTLFWMRKAVRLNPGHGVIELVVGIEKDANQSCANCEKAAECFSEKLKQCARCKAAWYCGKDCQVKHWKVGHKIDCVKQD